MNVQIIGRITGDPEYREKFAQVAAALRTQGHRVWNPAELPEGWEYEDYMTRCLAELERQEAICRIEGWRESPGAARENAKAARLGLAVLEATPGETVEVRTIKG